MLLLRFALTGTGFVPALDLNSDLEVPAFDSEVDVKRAAIVRRERPLRSHLVGIKTPNLHQHEASKVPLEAVTPGVQDRGTPVVLPGLPICKLRCGHATKLPRQATPDGIP